MFFESSPEFKIRQNEKKLRELRVRVDSLNKEVDGFLTSLGVSSEQLTAYVENRENFDDETWEKLQDERQKLDAKLTFELESVSDPTKTKKAYETLNVAPHWIFVR
ncbi:MAG: hypothetical protein H7A37_01850 [Chlamydiales bacterium]|nr:hypothetical protein [Chlamydiia bacterium]MCP5507033.1 hypothetical protein [Chlamydiales bacterium]